MDKIDISAESLQAIFFDFDGVLAECMDVKTEAFAQLFEQFGDEIVKKVVKHHVENGGISRYVKIQHYYLEYLNEQISKGKLNGIAQQFSDIVVKKVIESSWVNGAKEFLEKYYISVDLYVISGTPEGELREIVKERKMEKYFKGVYGSPDTKPVIARRIISEKGYDPNRVVYVGDSISDYRDAVKVEILFLGRVPSGSTSPFPENIPKITDFFEIIK